MRTIGIYGRCKLIWQYTFHYCCSKRVSKRGSWWKNGISTKYTHHHERKKNFITIFVTTEFVNLSIFTEMSQLFTTQSWLLKILGKVASWKHCGKRRKCWWPAFSPFPTKFLSFPKQISFLQSHLFCRLQMLSIWTCQKFCRLEKG